MQQEGERDKAGVPEEPAREPDHGAEALRPELRHTAEVQDQRLLRVPERTGHEALHEQPRAESGLLPILIARRGGAPRHRRVRPLLLLFETRLALVRVQRH